MIKRFIPFIFSGALGLVGVIMMQQYLKQQQQVLEQERAKLMADFQNRVDVIAARSDIPEGTVITADHLGLVTIPEKFVQPYATSHATDLIGRVSVAPIAEGEQILKNKIREASEGTKGDTLSKLTPPGKRAITLGMDELTGVGGFVRPGDAVDVIWSFQVPVPGSNEAELVTTTLFQGLRVLAVGPQIIGRVEGDRHEGGGYTVTIGLDPQEASLLLYARERGKVEVSLRPRAEEGRKLALPPTNMGLVMEHVLGQMPPAGVEMPQKSQRVVEVFRGLERNVVTVDE